MSQPHFEGVVRSPLTLPKMGLGSPPGLPKTQSAIAGVKTPCIEAFFISLERSWSVDVQKWPRMSHLDICSTSYGRKKGRESNWQFDSRPPKVGNRPDSGACRWSVTHRWKVLEDSYSFSSDLVRSEFEVRSYEHPKSRESKPGQFRDSTLGVSGKRAIWMQVRWRAADNTIWGKVVVSPESGPWWVKWVQGCPWFVPTPKGCRMSSNQLVVSFGCKIA
jgi:hypothetical protein